VEGVLTVGLAIIFGTFIPNTPQRIRWLSQVEKDQLLYRLEVDRGTKDATDEVSVGKGFMLAILDVKTWLLCSCLQMNYIAASVTNFCTSIRWRDFFIQLIKPVPIVVSGLGFSRTITLAITAPPYLICCAAILVNGWHSDKKQEVSNGEKFDRFRP
jgi:hypothetical protein